MNTIVTQWVLSIHQDGTKHPDKRRFMCFPVRSRNRSPTKPLPLFESFETRPVLPIFPSKSECLRFRDEVVCHYHSHMTEWEMYFPIDDRALPDRCRSVYVENALRNRSQPKNDTFQSHPVPFDFSNDEDNIVVTMSLRSHMGFFVVHSFDVCDQILSMNGVLVDSSYDNVSSEEHVRYLCDNLENNFL